MCVHEPCRRATSTARLFVEFEAALTAPLFRKLVRGVSVGMVGEIWDKLMTRERREENRRIGRRLQGPAETKPAWFQPTNCDQTATIQRLTVEVDALREEDANIDLTARRNFLNSAA
eukprot:symbB.v1.2.037726.t3/scaffold5649.1/size36637/1